MMGKEEVYLVPGIQNKEDFRLALKLQVPVLGADPAKSIIYRTKSGCRRIFAAADVNTAPGVYDIQNEVLLFFKKNINMKNNRGNYYYNYQKKSLSIQSTTNGSSKLIMNFKVAELYC